MHAVFWKRNAKAFQINCLKYPFMFPNQVKLHSQTHQIKNAGKPSSEAV